MVRECLNAAPDPEAYDEGARIALARNCPLKDIEVRGNGLDYLQQFKRYLLNNGAFEEVAYLQWGPGVFNVKPNSVKRIWDGIRMHNKLAVIGAGGMGKTFTIIVYLVLEYDQDPEYTTIKLISSSGGSADANARATLATLWKTAAIPIQGEIQASYIGLDVNERRFGIERIAIPQGDDAKARLRGKCHPFPRRSPHQMFGTHSRVRVLADEDENIPIGFWDEIQNVLSGSDSFGSIKVMRANNPKDKASLSGQNNEPVDGWESVSVDTDEWVSKTGWHVLHIDGAKCENVTQKSVIHPGLLTYDGFMQYVRDPLPPEYWTYGRGWYPPQGVQGSIITENLLGDARGIYLWSGIPKNIAGCDTALEGGDDCTLAMGKYGLAHSFIPVGGDAIRFPRPRWCIQAETLVVLPKGDTVAMVNQIRTQCQAFNVSPECLTVDRTGNGAGVHDLLKTIWSPNVMGCDFSGAASPTKMFEEDSLNCDEMYLGIVTELWFAMRRYLEFGYLKFMPAMSTADFYPEFLGRKYETLNKKLRVESKRSHKARMRKSPDRSDAISLMIKSARSLSPTVISMVTTNETVAPRMVRQTYGVAESVEMIEFEA